MIGEEWPQGYDGPGQDQMRRIAANTTPAERVRWLQETLLMLWRNNLLPNKFDEYDPMGTARTPH